MLTPMHVQINTQTGQVQSMGKHHNVKHNKVRESVGEVFFFLFFLRGTRGADSFNVRVCENPKDKV